LLVVHGQVGVGRSRPHLIWTTLSLMNRAKGGHYG
jgi:hypothetical protein